MLDTLLQETDTPKEGYTVLARKYRPQNLSELIGQDMLVQTLTNAISEQRLPHAFVFTGIRGVGKTSTARIVARSLLCEGKEGELSSPTIEPCGVCRQCKAIASDSHVDVMEMDAASRTGVGDIREIIDGISYAPVMGRYKIYIIDEVHMLSKSAFNALLKTLEEPPAHIKFIFATTEIRKIPVTILSRCMRFDLPRVELEELAGHFSSISKKEGASVDDAALSVIANAAEGSVRDGLSLLDQVIGTYGNSDEVISRAQVEALIGISGKESVLTLLELLAKGETKEAILHFRSLYHKGADPVQLLGELAEVVHLLTQLKVIPDADYYTLYGENTVDEAKRLAVSLAIPYLARLWQMITKAITEVDSATNLLAASEMVLVRIAYVSDMPSSLELAEQVKKKSLSA